MKLKVDEKAYTKKQEVFIGEVIVAIADRLEEYGIKGAQLKELTGKIAFDIACMVDDTADLEFEGIEANPYLTFLNGDDELIHLGGNSYTHELVYGILNAMFKEDT